MKLTPELVADLARLARLDMSADEQATFVTQLPKIVEYVGQLQAISTTNQPPSRDEAVHFPTDTVQASDVAESILDQAPERQGRFWKVPKVL